MLWLDFLCFGVRLYVVDVSTLLLILGLRPLRYTLMCCVKFSKKEAGVYFCQRYFPFFSKKVSGGGEGVIWSMTFSVSILFFLFPSLGVIFSLANRLLTFSSQKVYFLAS